MNHLNLRLTVLSPRGKNFFPPFCQVLRSVRNIPDNAVIALQGPLCAAETANSQSNHPLGSPQSQQVSEARNRANPGSHFSWNTWQSISTKRQAFMWLYVSSYLTLPPKRNFFPSPNFSQLKILVSQNNKKKKAPFKKRSTPFGTSRCVANTQERGSTGYVGQLNPMQCTSLCTRPFFTHKVKP